MVAKRNDILPGTQSRLLLSWRIALLTELHGGVMYRAFVFYLLGGEMFKRMDISYSLLQRK
jgi:hypothetical protein